MKAHATPNDIVRMPPACQFRGHACFKATVYNAIGTTSFQLAYERATQTVDALRDNLAYVFRNLKKQQVQLSVGMLGSVQFRSNLHVCGAPLG